MFGRIRKDNILKVKSYSIDTRDVLGTGAFGVVFKGTDAKKNTIAAKRIDVNDHPRILTQDLDRLMQLDHPNVMKILDVQKTESILWMMMPFCELGDLNRYYRKRDVSNETNLNLMKQIMAGVKYLHSQDIVHRDIKPGNILVAAELPLLVLLADFDFSKCLDPEVETSLMTSNVGTLAFKAPEFFQRTSEKIEYHRNVDIYAAGLTFLAILQAEKGKKMLIPHIETHGDDSELHVPSIGQLISTRIMYKVPELSIVKTEGPQKSLKSLISRMTCNNPEERLSAENVLLILNNLETVETCLKSEVQEINLVCEGTHEQVPELQTADVNKQGQILARVKVGDRYFIQVLDRFGSKKLFPAIASSCIHSIACVMAHPSDPRFVLEGCHVCKVINNYNTDTRKCCVVHTELTPRSMCHGPTGSILVRYFLSPSTTVEKLKWENAQLQVNEVYKMDERILKWCYAESFNVLVIMGEDKEIKAGKLGSNNPIWKLSGVVGGHMLQPDALTSDAQGNVYVSDGTNNRILKINGLNGNIMSVLLLPEENIKPIDSLFWSDTKPNLTLKRGVEIGTYNVQKFN